MIRNPFHDKKLDTVPGFLPLISLLSLLPVGAGKSGAFSVFVK